MSKFENLSINKIFENRKEFIAEIGEQLEEESKIEVEINGEKLSVDLRVISIQERENKKYDPVMLLPGFGSGWEGISELGFSLAAEGRKVIMPSLPGYGNSDNPPEEYFRTDNFDNEAEVLSQLIEKMELYKEKVHIIGHSMGAEIAATLAKNHPDQISSLVLMNPAGVEEKENIVDLGKRFAISGTATSVEYNIRSFFSGEENYEKGLRKYIPKTRSPFGGERVSQRLSEAKRLSKGRLLKNIKNIKCPITFISGELDTVFPPGKTSDENSQLSRIAKNTGEKNKFEKSVMDGLRHNMTYASDEITAANIEHYLEKAEE